MIRQIILTPNCIYKKQSQLFFPWRLFTPIRVFLHPIRNQNETLSYFNCQWNAPSIAGADDPKKKRERKRATATSPQKCTHILSKSAIHEDIGFRHLFARPFHLAKLDEGRRHRLFSLLGVSIVETNP